MMERRMRAIHNQHGMTLVEMILSLVVFSIISTGIINMFLYASNSFAAHQTLVSEQAELRLAMNYITSELSLATMVVASDDEVTTIEGVGTFTQLSVEGSGMDGKIRRKLMPSGVIQYPFPMRVEGLELSFEFENIRPDLTMIKVRLSTKRYTLEQDVLCLNTPLPSFVGTSSQKRYISYVKPVAS